MPRKHAFAEYVDSIRIGRERHSLTYSGWLKYVKGLTSEEIHDLFYNSARSHELNKEHEEWLNEPWINHTWSDIPLRVYDRPLMTRVEYYSVSDFWGYNRNFKELVDHEFLCNLDEGVVLIRNGVYGHRHWISLRNNRIVGLTVGHAGWMTERYFWKEAGFTVGVLEGERGARFLIIGKYGL